MINRQRLRQAMARAAVRIGRKMLSSSSVSRHTYFSLMSLTKRMARGQRTPTAQIQTIHRHGGPFLERISRGMTLSAGETQYYLSLHPCGAESPVEVRLTRVRFGNSTPSEETPIGRIKLGFTPNGVVAEAIQGIKGEWGRMEEFKKQTQQSWAPAMMEVIEKLASETGYKQVLIRKPQTLMVYREYRRFHPRATVREMIKARQQMKRRYYRIAKKMEYEEKGEFFVKELDHQAKTLTRARPKRSAKVLVEEA